MKKYALALTAYLALLVTACSQPSEKITIGQYPVTRKVDTIDTYFGVKVADPYRWLENDTTRETTDWVKAENAVTFGFLNQIPYREKVKKRLETLNNYEKIGAPFREGNYIYFYKNEGLQNHAVLYRKKGEAGTPEVFLDPNTFSKDGTTKLAAISFSKDGSRAAYQISRGGADWADAIIINTEDKKQLEDTLRDIKFSTISWKGNDAYYFSASEKPQGSMMSAKMLTHTLFYHKVGTPHSLDKLIFGGRRHIVGVVSNDERFLIITTGISSSGSELFIMDLNDQKRKVVSIINNFDNYHNVIANEGSRLIIQTNLNAPNNRIVEVDFSRPTPEHWRDIIPETKNVMSASEVGGSLFLIYSIDVKSAVKQYDLQGKFIRDLELPGIGSVPSITGRSDEKELYYSFTSFAYPTTIFKYEIASGKSTVYAQPRVNFNSNDYEVKQVFYPGKDGTKIPMFIVHKKGLSLDGKNPTLLYGYGGFNNILTATFSPSRMVWLENGGVYAQPNLRGGGEYGETWHKAGTKMNKQNVFDDFIAAAEYLIQEKYTSNQYLALSGASNGGLLVGATMTQRPDLAKVALPAVGVMDMLRYHTFTGGAGWYSDYGVWYDSKEMFEYLKKYSPLHALKDSIVYPATMVITADHDDRVVPAHSFKFGATLQEKNIGTNPILIRIDVKSGHSSSNLSKTIELLADQYTFAWYNMGVIPPIAKGDM